MGSSDSVSWWKRVSIKNPFRWRAGYREHLRTPRTLARIVNPGMTSVVDNEEGLLILMLFDHVANLEHQFEMGVLGWDGEDIGVVTVIFSKTFFQILQLRQHEQIVTGPM